MLLLPLLLATALALTPAPPCASPPGSTALWCDHTKPLEARVAALVGNLSIAEKAGLFTNGASEIKRIHWPQYNWWSEALHGVARAGMATSFPQICGIGASFNKTLFHALGDMTSTEARGKNNALNGQQYHGLTLWAPNINIFRDPRWGRGQETPGEDPVLTSSYAEGYVTGLQGSDKTYLKASSCLKHYAAYSEEQGRLSFAAVVTKQDMEDSYLPAFQAGVQRGNASAIMCSYNAETYGNGIYGPGNAQQHGAIPSCANKYLMNDLARDTWGFDGYITSDCGAVGEVHDGHKYTNTTGQTVNAVLQAGMDTDCGGYMNAKTMADMMTSKQVSMELIDTALTRLFRVQFRLGFADPRELVPYSELNGYNASVVNTPAHQQLAKEAADQSLVLLKNDHGTLPLTAPSDKKSYTVAVIGRNANATNNMQGNYFGTAPFLISPLMGLAEYAATTYSDGGNVGEAVKLARAADAVVLVVGLVSEAEKHPDEAEGHDRTSLLLPGNQDQLIKEVAEAAGKTPVVVVVMSGGPVDVSAVKNNAKVEAIMWCGYPGQAGGAAIADAIFGRTNAFGKLSMTWYPESFAQKVAMQDMGMRPNATTGNPGRTHRFYTGTPVFAFGTGLSYTSFDMSLDIPQEVDLTSLRGGDAAAATARVAVSNMGARAGDAVVLLFAAPPNAGRDGVALQALVAFARVAVAPGETQHLSLDIPSSALRLADAHGDWRDAHGTWRFWVEGGSTREVEVF